MATEQVRVSIDDGGQGQEFDFSVDRRGHHDKHTQISVGYRSGTPAVGSGRHGGVPAAQYQRAGSSSAGSGYEVSPDGVRHVASSISDIVYDISAVLSAMRSAVLAAAAFARIGATAAAADAQCRAQLAYTLAGLQRALSQTSNLLGQAANGYDTADQEVAAALGGGGTAASGVGDRDTGGGQRGAAGRALRDQLISQGTLPSEFASMTPEQAHEYLKRHPDIAARVALNDTWQPPTGDHTQVRSAFEQMSPDDREWTALMSPASVGNLSGAPFAQRAEANDVRIADELQAERGRLNGLLEAELRGPQTEDGQELAPLISGSGQRVEYYERLLSGGHTVLYFDPSGDGSIAEQYGTIDDHTRNVGVLVPGTTAKLTTFESYVGDRARSFVDTDPNHSLAMVGWMGGDEPDTLLDAASSSYEVDLGPRLANFSHDLRQEIDHTVVAPDNVQITVAGHSYGGAVVGTAETYGLDANRVLHIESAGMGHGVRDPGDLHNTNTAVHRYSMTVPNDPIHYVQGIFAGYGPHGADPDDFPGVVRLETGDYPDGTPIGSHGAVASHSDVFTYRSDAWWQMYHVLTGGTVRLYQSGQEIQVQ